MTFRLERWPRGVSSLFTAAALPPAPRPHQEHAVSNNSRRCRSPDQQPANPAAVCEPNTNQRHRSGQRNRRSTHCCAKPFRTARPEYPDRTRRPESLRRCFERTDESASQFNIAGARGRLYCPLWHRPWPDGTARGRAQLGRGTTGSRSEANRARSFTQAEHRDLPASIRSIARSQRTRLLPTRPKSS